MSKLFKVFSTGTALVTAIFLILAPFVSNKGFITFETAFYGAAVLLVLHIAIYIINTFTDFTANK